MRSRGCATSVDSRPAVRPEIVSTRTGGIPFWGVLLMKELLWALRVVLSSFSHFFSLVSLLSLSVSVCLCLCLSLLLGHLRHVANARGECARSGESVKIMRSGRSFPRERMLD